MIEIVLSVERKCDLKTGTAEDDFNISQLWAEVW